MPFRDDLLNLCYRLRDEKLLVTSELEQILLLNSDVEEGTVGVVKACWIQSHQHETLSRLVQLHVDGTLQNCCAQLSYYENAVFRDAAALLPNYTSTLTELLRLLLNNSRLVANVLHLLDTLEPPFSDEACRILFTGAFGCCQFVGDEKCLVEALSCLMRLQLVSNSQLDLRRTLRKGRGSFCKLYRLLIESLSSAKLFLTSALHAPVLRLISQNELFLDLDPERAAMRLSASEKLAYYGAEGSVQYKENVAGCRNWVIQQLVSSTRQFIQSIKASMHCFPPSLGWLLRQLYSMLRYAARLVPTDCDLICTELVFTYFLCPAIANPEAFGILSDMAIGSAERFNLIQIGQILQTLAVSKWDSTDPKLVELYGQFEGDSVSSIVDSIVCNSSPHGGLEDIYQLDGKLTRHLSAMTIEELDKLLNLIRRVLESSSSPPEVEAVWNEMKQLLNTLPTSFCVSPQQDGEPTPSRTRSYIKLPRSIGISLIKSPSESDSSNSVSSDAPVVLLIPISSSPEPIGLLPEEKVMLMVRQEKYHRGANMACNAKRTRFLLNADAESVGASSDHFDEAASDEQASLTSSVDQMTNADISALNDNFSDVDVVPMSANVSGRGSPSISGRDTPSSVPLDANDNAYELSSQSTSGNSALPKVSSGSLPIPAIKEAAMEERFGKFGIPRPTRESHRDETHSMVSDSWSTDVLASDSEMGGETAGSVATNGAQSGLLPDLVPCQTPSIPRFDLVPMKPMMTSCKVPPSDQSSVCDRSDTWSVDAAVSDSENEPGIRQDERLQEFENDVFPSISGCQPSCSSIQPTSEEGDQPETSGTWDSRKKLMQRQSSGSSFHSEVPDDLSLHGTDGLAGGSSLKDTRPNASSSSPLPSSFRSYLSAAAAAAAAAEGPTSSFRALEESEELSVMLQSSTSRNRSANFAAAMARKLSPHVNRVMSMRAPSFSLLPPYESTRDGLLKGLKFRALRARPTVNQQNAVVSAPIDEVDMDTTGDQILEKYRTMRAESSGGYDLIASSGDPPMGKLSDVALNDRLSSNVNPIPYFDGTNVTQCQAFADAKRKLRLLLCSVDVDALPVTMSRLSLSKELKEGDELLQLLRTMLADTVVTESKPLTVQLEDLTRLATMFDAKGLRKLLKTMHDEHCRRSAYATYLQQSKLTLLQQRSLLQRMLVRVQREQRLVMRSVLELCVHLFLEQRCDGQLKSFVQQFQQLQTQDEKTDLLERFLRTVYASVETEPMLQGCTSKQISYVQVCIERLVLTRIYFSALYPNGEGDIMRDKIFHETVERLGAIITPSHKSIAIPLIYHAESPWPSAQAELAIINVQKTPREKVNCVRRCCETVLQLLSLSGSNVPSADDLMPVLVFVVIKTNPEALLSTIQYVNGFYGNRLRGEDAYWWAQFCSVVEFIKILADMDA
uniref:Receptor-mediated endocytosis protein 6 n=1 Tax=Trichuris muris TaxID=70415 RepID=A0A5S6R644_TRIMR